MTGISYLKHCTQISNLPNILKDGYIRSSNDLKYQFGYGPHQNKIYTQIVFYYTQSVLYEEIYTKKTQKKHTKKSFF